jgi:hypothetical protein
VGDGASTGFSPIRDGFFDEPGLGVMLREEFGLAVPSSQGKGFRVREDELQAARAGLVASELVFQRGVPPDAVYAFKQTAERTGERWLEAELYRHKGQLLLRQGHPAAAEEFYKRALSIAREQEAKLWELRAAASLARLRRDQGRRAEARDLLASIYGWFTEGFGTPDLLDAKGLLAELA